MSIELVISVIAILVILGMGKLGMHFGVFYELTTTLLLFLGMMVVLRYWYPVTCWMAGWFGGGAGYAAFTTYWILFLAGCSPLILIMKRLTESATPKYPRLLDSVLGLVFGLISATILVCCLMTSLSVLIPKLWEPYDRSALLLPFDQAPIVVYQTIERDVLHVPVKDPGHTRFPTFEKADSEDLSKYWK